MGFNSRFKGLKFTTGWNNNLKNIKKKEEEEEEKKKKSY